MICLEYNVSDDEISLQRNTVPQFGLCSRPPVVLDYNDTEQCFLRIMQENHSNSPIPHVFLALN